MGTVTLKGATVHTSGMLPTMGSVAPNFTLVKSDLSSATLASFGAKKKILNIFPSIDTGTCATSVRKFNHEAASLENTVVLNISADLPFAQSRFCGAEGIKNAESLSTFRSPFPRDYGLLMTDGPLTGLCARAVVVLDEQNRVLHAQLVSEIAQEPDYSGAIRALNQQ
jgi:thiol peroxidase